MTDRERFEAWIRARGRDVRRHGKDHPYAAGQYRSYTVQFAWEALREAQRPQIEDIGKALKDAGTGVRD